MLRKFYDTFVLKYPKTILILMLVSLLLLGYQARKLEVDASAETLTLEDDKDLELTREITARYKTPDFLVITFTPEGDLLAKETLDTIRQLKGDLLKLKRVESVTSILDVPLLESPPKPVKEMLKSVPTLESPGIDMALARKEFLNSPIYQNNLVSQDFKTTALLVNLRDDPMWHEFVNRRNALRRREKDGTITESERAELARVIVDFKKHRDAARIVDHDNIQQVRAIMDKYRDHTDLFLGGVSMIADDLVNFVKNDLEIFGVGVLLFLIVTLKIIFKRIRWILLPILCCGFSVVATCGLLGLFGWEVTVISSNFISIQIIITMAMTIHLIVRYRELVNLEPNATQRELVLESVVSMAKPCFYAILTTVAGFGSLILCDILPVINFGWMMSAGIGISLFLTFLIFPVVLMQMEKLPPLPVSDKKASLTAILGRYTENHGGKILAVAVLVLLFSGFGASRLMVENSFIDYFNDSTEIYKGMSVIDRQLGGTTPLDVVLNFNEPEADASSSDKAEEVADELDEFEDEFEEAKNEAQYWFTEEKMKEIEAVHDYLDALPETGKVMSMATMLKVGKTLNGGKPLDNFMLALIYNELPDRFKKIVLSPFVSVENNQVRFSVRIVDSNPDLRRNELLKRIRTDLREKFGLNKDRVQLASLAVLYNNMLQSLFNSQIKTLGAVILALMVMFLILFRSFTIAMIAIIPNILSVGVVLGFMGWAKIPLDMMTITLASISVGIAVDDTIHYIHRFMEEFKKDRNYVAAMHRSHDSIGYAMYYTSITIIIGFSILVFSNFIPSIYFGVLTGLAMVIALIAALTLLPQLIIFLKPLGPEQ